MELTPDLVSRKAEEYEDEEPLYAVEAEHIETLPDAFGSGDYGWRDAMWVVQWHYRRYLGEYPDSRRRSAEKSFESNDFDAVHEAIATAVATDNLGDRIGVLTDLEGVDVPVASAFLMFIDPEQFIVIGDREWRVLADAGRVPPEVPERFSTDDYRTYLRACRSRCEAGGYSMWSLYRAIWRLRDGSE